MLQLKLSAIKEMEKFARTIPDIISLSQGGLKLEQSPREIKDFVSTVLNTTKVDYYGHGAGLPELRETIAKNLSDKHHTDISPEQILITHGCNGALSTLMLLLLQQGDEVILPEPAYPAYTNLTQIARAKPIYIPSCNEIDNTLTCSLPVQKIRETANEKTKMIVFSNPSNPTSTIAGQTDLIELISWCEENGIYLIVDEVYEDYIFEGDYYSVTPLVKNSKYLIKVSSFSKNFGLSGWRVGYIVIPTHLFNNIHIMQDSLFIAPSVIGQYAALGALKNPHIAQYYHDYVKENRNITCNTLDKLQGIKYSKPQAGFYAFIKTNHADTTDLCLDIMKNAKISLVPGGTFGSNSHQYMRLCFARDREILNEALQRLTDYWKNKNV